ncbi:MAG: outer membrane lipoprotein LolB [Proteobacteria bacterium]|nr:outer membrane lipoprotein LolB [Pseudomonadota bacterium]
MTRFLLLFLTVSLSSLMLGSCASVEEKPASEPQPEQQAHMKKELTPAGWTVQKEKRQQIKNWEVRGRLGVQTETEGATMDIIWKQAEDEYSIRLIAPLGAGSYLILGDNELARIRYPDGKKRTVRDIDDVFKATLKVDLPVTAIKDWIRGLPAKDLSIEKIRWNEKGLLKLLEQEGWNVELKKYAGTDILLPHEIYLTRDDDEELDIRLLFRQWLVDN